MKYDDIWKKLFKNKINYAKKEYKKIKKKKLFFKKEKRLFKKIIEEGEKIPFIPKTKILKKKIKSMNLSNNSYKK